MVSLLLLALVAVLAWWLFAVRSGPAAQTPPPPAQRVSVVDGVTVIKLDPETQAHSGIRTARLAPADARSETTAYATVMDLQPLLDFRTRYESAKAQAEAASAAATASRQEYQRDRILYRDNRNVSLKVLQAATASFRADQAKAEAAARAMQDIHSAALQQFGQTLEGWALDLDSPRFARLVNRQDVLLRVTVPPGNHALSPQRIEVDAGDGRRLPAELVSSSPQNDPAVQGSAFIYRVAAPIAAGSRITAYLPASKAATPGVLVPGSAIVWYGGQPWAYVQAGKDRFARTPVPVQFPLDDGYVATHGFRPGASVVISGAQLLLSEELRPQPGSTSACKDPECD